MNWTELQITDKTGKVGWKTAASPVSVNSEVKNLMRHVEGIRVSSPAYASAGLTLKAFAFRLTAQLMRKI
jgi:hypothetical protein